MIYLDCSLWFVPIFFNLLQCYLCWCVTNHFEFCIIMQKSFSQQEGNRVELQYWNWNLLPHGWRWFYWQSSGGLNFCIGAASCKDGLPLPPWVWWLSAGVAGWPGLGPWPASALPSWNTEVVNLLPPCSLKQSHVAEDCPSAKQIFRQRSELQACVFLQLRLQTGN